MADQPTPAANGSRREQRPPHPKRYNVRYPQRDQKDVPQDDEWCELIHDGADGNNKHPAVERIRFHDYESIYRHPGLYEQLFDDELKCASPYVMMRMLAKELCQPRKKEEGYQMPTMRPRIIHGIPIIKALDLGAGNGMMGEQLRKLRAHTVVGCDLLPAAREAALRDRPGVYDEYLVGDITALLHDSGSSGGDQKDARCLRDAGFNVLTTVSALGFGDIPWAAFAAAISLIQKGGLVAFNLKDKIYAPDEHGSGGDDGGKGSTGAGFAVMISQAVRGGHLEILAQHRYRHRLSVTGEPLYYYGIVAVKHGDMPMEKEVHGGGPGDPGNT